MRSLRRRLLAKIRVDRDRPTRALTSAAMRSQMEASGARAASAAGDPGAAAPDRLWRGPSRPSPPLRDHRRRGHRLAGNVRQLLAGASAEAGAAGDGAAGAGALGQAARLGGKPRRRAAHQRPSRQMASGKAKVPTPLNRSSAR